MSPRASLLAIAAATMLLVACGKETVSTYRVAKEKEPEPPAALADGAGSASPASGGSMGDTPVPTAVGTSLVWRAPSQWSAKPATAMRRGSYSVPGDSGEADLSITAFPGDVGGELANVNRWRSQIGLAPLRAEELEANVARVESNGLKMTVVELLPKGDPAGKAIVGAIVPWGGSTWFFKMMGPGPSVKAAQPSFLEFLHTVRTP